MFAILHALAASVDYTDIFYQQYDEIISSKPINLPYYDDNGKAEITITPSQDVRYYNVTCRERNIKITSQYMSIVKVTGNYNKITVSGPAIVQIEGDYNTVKNTVQIGYSLSHPLIRINGTDNEVEASWEGRALIDYKFLFIIFISGWNNKLPSTGNSDLYLDPVRINSTKTTIADIANIGNVNFTKLIENNSIAYKMEFRAGDSYKHDDPVRKFYLCVVLPASIGVIVIIALLISFVVYCIHTKRKENQSSGVEYDKV
ncbi:hypothetical protein TVAG_461800 [Trichomonas vaginalis G3]|uniref:Uncharacterized protein n=1 Tax=Trichomonas vaginalis (strain ATCC PRA-98 / G3) TaxID=412133 RepID=A2FI54_TRIV3|nr:hypothetical protein TVAGG3_0604140 [Trichomonas vaginalis G3]EAX95407.1 hypothetical protein TVAG_461800 [Trichomonas vaginalis G3]KAI5524126.1 hypothetical protein TVAGG3_0604140 [Trichomonas vaginalis G3]|eukprot:XP_001308337.1 hypothetical protein [Trichomonas vaginalis G3]